MVTKNSKKLLKSTTGVQGFDEILNGGFPKGRTTLICGNAGCGKTLLSMEFLLRGAIEYDEPGVFMAFEETAHELAQNVESLGYDLDDLIKQKKIIVDNVHMEPSEIDETGEYDLEGLFIRLGHAIGSAHREQEELDKANELALEQEIKQKQKELERKRRYNKKLSTTLLTELEYKPALMEIVRSQ